MTPKNKKLINKRGCHRSFTKYNDEPFLIYEKILSICEKNEAN